MKKNIHYKITVLLVALIIVMTFATILFNETINSFPILGKLLFYFIYIIAILYLSYYNLKFNKEIKESLRQQKEKKRRRNQETR